MPDTDDTTSSALQARTDYRRAAAGYDAAFERALAEALFDTIADASRVTDRDVVALRSSETIAALCSLLITIAATRPGMDVPSRQREFAEQLAKRVRRGLAQCRGDPDFAEALFATMQAEGSA